MTSRSIEDLHPEIKQSAILFLANANSLLFKTSPSLSCRIICTYRSQKEQDELFAQGRTKPGRKVTWLKTGAHQTDNPETPGGDSEAFDFGIFESGEYLTGKDKYEISLYRILGPIGEDLGLEWGGKWSTPDYPHFQRKGWKELK